jgi:hypothetical protein
MVALYQRQVVDISRPGPGRGLTTFAVALVTRPAKPAGAPRPRGPPTLHCAHMTLGRRRPAQVLTKIHPSDIKRTD